MANVRDEIEQYENTVSELTGGTTGTSSSDIDGVFVNLVNASELLHSQHKALLEKHEKLEDDNNKICEDNAALKDYVLRLKTVVDEMGDSLKHVKKRKKELKHQVQDLNRTLKSKDDEIEHLEKQLEEAKSKISELEEEQSSAVRKTKSPKTFQCPICQKWLCWNSRNFHLSTHSEIKYSCGICHRSYKRKSGLADHSCRPQKKTQ